jgi:hypothetical protein
VKMTLQVEGASKILCVVYPRKVTDGSTESNTWGTTPLWFVGWPVVSDDSSTGNYQNLSQS